MNADDLAMASDFVLSIEPMPDSDPAPSAIKIIGGSFSRNNATVTVAHAAALGNDFMNIMRNYVLATPTTATMENERSCVWFLDISSGMPMSGLDLP